MERDARLECMDMYASSTNQEKNTSRLVKKLLWQQIAERIPLAERDTVRRVVGESMWSENDSLFLEVEALESILNDMEEERERNRKSHALLQHPASELLQERVVKLVHEIQQATAMTAKYCGEEHASKLTSKLLPVTGGRVRILLSLVTLPFFFLLYAFLVHTHRTFMLVIFITNIISISLLF